MNEQEIQTFLSERVNVPSHFSYANGIVVQSITPMRGLATLQIGETSCNPGGYVHGGALMTLADTVGGCFVVANMNTNCVTSTSSFEFLRPATGPTITCTATPKKMGRNICTVAVNLTDVDEKLVAAGTFTFFLLNDG